MSSKDKKEKEKKEKDKGGKDKGGKDHKKTVSFGAEPEPAHHDHQKKKHEKVSHPEQTLDEKQVKLEGNMIVYNISANLKIRESMDPFYLIFFSACSNQPFNIVCAISLSIADSLIIAYYHYSNNQEL
jgi:hypothetical protein